jgi:uncharacterized protein (TIGR00730 family)
MATVDEVRLQIQQTLERYQQLEAQLQQLEKDRFRVCIFGSARIRPEDPTYRMVYDTARRLAELNIDIVTGGGPGLMEAASLAVRDAHNGVSQSIGLPIQLPRSLELANKHLDVKSEHKRFSSRLDEFMRLSHAVIVAPGGIGTLLELVYVWQLLQVGMVENRPLILMDRGLWRGLLAWVHDSLLSRGFIGPHDLGYVQCVDTPQEALDHVRGALETFHAARAQKAEGMPRAAEAARIIEELERKQAGGR